MNAIDYKLLKYVKKCGKRNIAQINQKMKQNSQKRIDNLYPLIQLEFSHVDDIGGLVFFDHYVLSDQGICAIEDYKQEHKIERLKFWIPIIISNIIATIALIVSILK